MQLTKLFLSLIAFQQCDASAIAAKAIAGVTEIAVNLNPYAAGAVAISGAFSAVYKYQG